MLTRNSPQKVKLICGFIYRDETVYGRTKPIIKEKLGPIDYETKSIPFNFTRYYNREMGSPLYRRFVSFCKLINPESLVDIKLYCIGLEKKSAIDKNRSINIDPGYIDMARLILSTTKDFSHRIYIGKGIYAEVTLIYTKGGFRTLEWTYPDYKTNEYKKNFIEIRNIYKKQIRRNVI